MGIETRQRIAVAAVAAVAALAGAPGRANACYYHWSHGLPEPTGIWPTTLDDALNQVQTQDAADDQAITDAILGTAPVPAGPFGTFGTTGSAGSPGPAVFDAAIPTPTPAVLPAAVPSVFPTAFPAASPAATPASTPTVDAYVDTWVINTTGAKGRSTNSTINAAIDTISADVQEVAYTGTDVYIKATGIPDYNIGPFPGNPNTPANDNATFDIPRNPQPATGTHTATGLGAIGVLLNGVDVFNVSDGMSYQNQGVWHDNAGVVEASSFDTDNAHPQQQGVYHNHEFPVTLEAELGATATNPMVIGYAIDGYPIMNDYASLTPGGPIVKMMSGYELKTYAGNVRGNGGPNVSTTYPDGYFEEDYQYVTQTMPSGEAELDQYNGAFVYTPQFPDGTYAYFATTNAANTAATYPYMVGLDYYGTPSSDDLMGSVITVPGNAVVYLPAVPEPAGLGVVVGGLLLALSRRRTAAVETPART